MKNIKLFFNIILVSMIISVNIPIISYGAIVDYNNIEFDIPVGNYDLSGSYLNVYCNYQTNPTTNPSVTKSYNNILSDISSLVSRACTLVNYAPQSSGQSVKYIHWILCSTSNQLANYFSKPISLTDVFNVTYDGFTYYMYYIHTYTYYDAGGGVIPLGINTDYSMPMFYNSNGGNRVNVSDDTKQAIVNYLRDGNLSGSVQVMGDIQPDLGYIKPFYYCDGQSLNSNGGKNFIENIRWDKLSTTNFDVTQSGVVIDFAIRDKSYYQLTYDSSNLTSWIYNRVEFLSSYIYPVGSEQRAYMQGKITKSANNGNMILLGSPDGSQQTYNVNAWGAYSKNSNSDPVTRGFAQNLTNDTSDRNFINALYDYVTEHGVMLSWDIYARIRQGNNKGNWLKINKHSVPLDQQIDNLNGMVTSDNVILDTDPGNDWGGSNETDDPDEKDDILPVGYVDPNDGTPTTIYNNYTYNYDNRTWIENHYDNQTVDDVNQGFDILKNFGIFSNWFTMLFGPLLPDWCVGAIAICSPILVGLIVFRVIKGVIPFV